MIKKYVLVFLILSLSLLGALKPFQLLFIDLISPVIIFNKNTALNLQNALLFYQNIENIRQENQNLKRLEFYSQNLSKVGLVNGINDNEKTILEDLAKGDPQINPKFSIVEIVFYNTENNSLLVKAPDNSIVVGSIVTYGRYLIGDVVNVRENLLEVRLINKQGESLSGLLVNKASEKIRVNVVAENSNQLVINNILSTEVVEIGDTVYTSTTNPQFSSDLIVGTVERVEGISAQAFRKGYLGRPFDLEKLKYLIVIPNSK